MFKITSTEINKTEVTRDALEYLNLLCTYKKMKIY